MPSFMTRIKVNGVLKVIFLCLIVIFVLSGIVYFAWLNHNDFEKAVVKQAQDQLLVIAKSESQSIEEYITDINQELEAMSLDKDVREALGKEAKNSSFSLKSYHKGLEKLVDSIQLIDGQGKVVADSAQDVNINRYFLDFPDVKNVLENHQVFTSNVFRTSAGEAVIVHLHPIFVEGEFVGLIRAVISVARINNLASHINALKGGYAFIIDRDSNIISYPDIRNLGKNMADIIGSNFSQKSGSELNFVLNEMKKSEGTGIINFFSDGFGPQIVKTLITFIPINVGANTWAIAVAMDYDVIARLINKNLRDNILSVSFVLLVFFILAGLLYKFEKTKIALETTTSALKIINKQLHLEISERQKIEEELKSCLNPKNIKS